MDKLTPLEKACLQELLDSHEELRKNFELAKQLAWDARQQYLRALTPNPN